MKIRTGLIIALCIVACTGVAFAAEANRIATVSEFQGTVEAKIGGKEWAPVTEGMQLIQGDEIRTKANSFAVVSLDGAQQSATIEVKQNSQMGFAQFTANAKESTQSTMLDLALGEVLIKAKKLSSDKSKFEVKTPTSVVGVRGTTFSVAVEAVE